MPCCGPRNIGKTASHAQSLHRRLYWSSRVSSGKTLTMVLFVSRQQPCLRLPLSPRSRGWDWTSSEAFKWMTKSMMA